MRPLFLTSPSLRSIRAGGQEAGLERGKKGRNMNKRKGLKVKQDITLDGHFEKAICGVEIYETECGKSEVVVCKPKQANYKGISTTNYFENFASKIKRQYLSDKNHEKIKWFDRLDFDLPDTAPIEREVTMDFDGWSYSNASWAGTNAHG